MKVLSTGFLQTMREALGHLLVSTVIATPGREALPRRSMSTSIQIGLTVKALTTPSLRTGLTVIINVTSSSMSQKTLRQEIFLSAEATTQTLLHEKT
ncbi:MAG: hypothetical protein RID07_11690 [Lacipirellulaceae bacterium]